MGDRPRWTGECRDAREDAAFACARGPVPACGASRERPRCRPPRRRHGQQRGGAPDDGRGVRALPGARAHQRRDRRRLLLHERRAARGLRRGSRSRDAPSHGPSLHRWSARGPEAPERARRARAARGRLEGRHPRVPRRPRHAAAERAGAAPQGEGAHRHDPRPLLRHGPRQALGADRALVSRDRRRRRAERGDGGGRRPRLLRASRLSRRATRAARRRRGRADRGPRRRDLLQLPSGPRASADVGAHAA